jgi:hypothetical protein
MPDAGDFNKQINRNDLSFVLTFAGVQQIYKSAKLASILCLEGELSYLKKLIKWQKMLKLQNGNLLQEMQSK